jgi:hypothetical protein
MPGARKILRAQPGANNIALMRAAKLISFMIDYLIAVRFGDKSLGGI